MLPCSLQQIVVNIATPRIESEVFAAFGLSTIIT